MDTDRDYLKRIEGVVDSHYELQTQCYEDLAEDALNALDCISKIIDEYNCDEKQDEKKGNN